MVVQKVLRVGICPVEDSGTQKLDQRFGLAEVPTCMREELKNILSFYHMEQVEEGHIKERLDRFADWLSRAIEQCPGYMGKTVLVDIPQEFVFFLPGIQEVLVKKGFFPVYVMDRNDPWRMVIYPTW